MGYSNWFLLERLRRVIQKVRFLLTFNLIRSRLLGLGSPKSLSSPGSSSHWQRQLSFRDAPELIESGDQQDCEMGSPPVIVGTRCDTGGDADIDNRADAFIANFHRRLQMERQVSLALRYVDHRSESTSLD